MLEELDRSRARVEFLRRIGEWQHMARRLAHEIKNPLTPIQLAVEECHRRYPGENTEYQRILDTTLEVVAEEVGSLRRLVSEFASFARLPRAELAPSDLGEFLREQRAYFAAFESGSASELPGDGAFLGGVDLSFDVSDHPMPAMLDREMMHRALTNLVHNAARAIHEAGAAINEGERRGRVRVSAAAFGPHYVLDIDDSGPGILKEIRSTVFDPYVTTKRGGTGLGLSIVKKIIVDHGGTIDAGDSPLGGARFRIHLPRADTAAARAALERGAEGGARPNPPSASAKGWLDE
jgi:nitrogen fixation/metabolism regulation signal transduction histidine kinase